MNSFKLVKVHTGIYGEVKFGVVMPDGKVKDLPQVGSIWAYEPGNQMWAAKKAVLKSNVYGLLMFEPFKSKVAKPYELKEGEHFRTTEQMRTGRGYKTLSPE